MRDFEILESEDKYSLEKHVNSKLEGGYKLHGPLYVFHVSTSEQGVITLKYVQSVSYDDEA